MLGKAAQSSIRPVAIGAVIQTSLYGSAIPVYYGRTKGALYLIWAANLRQSGSTGGKKGKGKGKGSTPTYAQNVDFLIGHNPIAGVLQIWQNAQRLDLLFQKYSGGTTVPDNHFYYVLGVTVTVSNAQLTFADYGAQPRVIAAGTSEVPLWNAAYMGPDPTRPSITRRPYSYLWLPGSGPTITLLNAPAGTVNIYYAQIDGKGVNPKGKGISTHIPAHALRLTFEPILGDGPEFVGRDHSSKLPLANQQILYPPYAGIGSHDMDLGIQQGLPNVSAEILGSYPFYPTGDADFPDMVQDIFAQGLGQSGFNSAWNPAGTNDDVFSSVGVGQPTGGLNAPPYTGLQRGLNCFDLPGTIQLIRAGSVETFVQPMLFPMPNTAGNLLVVAVSEANNIFGGTPITPFAISDTAGNTWVPMFAAGLGYQVWVAYAIGGPALNTVTVTGISYNWAGCAMELAGVDLFDTFTVTPGTGVTFISSSGSDVQPGYMLGFAFFINGIGALFNPHDLPHWETLIPGPGHLIVYDQRAYSAGTFSLNVPAVNGNDVTATAILAFRNTQPSKYPKSLGNILDRNSLDLCRAQCTANGLYGSLLMDSQTKAADTLEMLYQCMNAAPVWSGFKLKSIPYSEVSTYGNGTTYTAPTAAGPLRTLTAGDFLNSPIISNERTAQVDIPNMLQIQHPNRSSDYNDVVVSEPESSSIARYGPRKDSPKQMRAIQDPAIARMILSVMIRRQNYLRNVYKFKLRAKWKLFEPMDLIAIPDPATGQNTDEFGNDITVPVQFTSIKEGADYSLDCEAVPYIYGCNSPVPLTVTQAQPFQPGYGADAGPLNAPVIFEPVPRLISQTNQGQIWIALSSASLDYAGSQVFMSTDGGLSYKSVGSNQGCAVTGYTMADWPASPDPDLTNDLAVDLTESNGQLGSYQIADEDAFTYPCYVGGGTTVIPYELMTYAIAEMTGPNTFLLKATADAPIALPTPVFNPPDGSLIPATVTISDANPAATIYYTTDGSTPTTSSILYAGPISVTTAETLKAVATASGSTNSAVASASYGFLPAPTFFPPDGAAIPATVSILDTITTAAIYYTTDGSTPTTGSTLYVTPVSITAATVLKAIASQTGQQTSAVSTASYGFTALPTFNPPSGSAIPVNVTISDATAGATIYYTTDGSTPTTSSTPYSAPVPVTTAETINAIASAVGRTNSGVASASYTVQPAATPTFNPPDGSAVPATVTISCATASPTIYYTTNGSTPTPSSTLYTGPVSVNVAETLKAIATAPSHLTSAVGSATYSVHPVATPTFGPPDGTVLFNPPQSISISCSTSGATIYYTTNGSTPTTSSAAYSSPIPVSVATTIKAMAAAPSMSNSPVASASYTFGTTPPPPTGVGTALLFQKTGPSTDSYYNSPSATEKTWIKSHISRLMYYDGFGQPRLSWSPPAWCYKDSSSLYHPSDDGLVNANPTWVLRDSSGNPVYLTWGCVNGVCPQYCPNYQSAGFLNYWISTARPLINAGFRGLFIDDVNLNISASNGFGSVIPIDPSTRAPMTQSAWGSYLCRFIEAIKAAFPANEIVINALWFNGNSDPSSDPNYSRLIRAADWFNMERGFNDGGITGGTGQFSLRQLFNVIDQIHGLGRNYIAQNLTTGSDFPLACYLATSQGKDLFCPGFDQPPVWPVIDYINLGNALGARYNWNGLIRRDYQSGIVLVSDPGGSGGGALGATYTDSSGNRVNSVSLGSRQGAILHV